MAEAIVDSKRIGRSDLAYIAGFFDGEGCVQIRKRGHRWEAMLRIVGTDYPQMERLARTFGVNLSRRPGTGTNKSHFEVCLQHKRAERWARLLKPYCRVKADELDLLLAFRETVHHGRTSVPASVEVHRREIAATCRALKRRRWPHDSWIAEYAASQLNGAAKAEVERG